MINSLDNLYDQTIHGLSFPFLSNRNTFFTERLSKIICLQFGTQHLFFLDQYIMSND